MGLLGRLPLRRRRPAPAGAVGLLQAHLLRQVAAEDAEAPAEAVPAAAVQRHIYAAVVLAGSSSTTAGSRVVPRVSQDNYRKKLLTTSFSIITMVQVVPPTRSVPQGQIAARLQQSHEVGEGERPLPGKLFFKKKLASRQTTFFLQILDNEADPSPPAPTSQEEMREIVRGPRRD